MIKLTALTVTALLFAACGSEPADPPPNAGNGNGGGGGQKAMDDHGAATMTEQITVFDRQVTVKQFETVKAGGEIAVTVEFASKDERCKAVRCWVGAESGKGSMRMRLPRAGDQNLHGHVEIPDPIPAGSKLWLEFEHDGDFYKKSFAYH